MKNFRKSFRIVLITLLLFSCLLPNLFAKEKEESVQPVTTEIVMLDILILRPIGVIIGILGTGTFILSLPFTIPAQQVDEAADALIVKPFHYSFKRPLKKPL